ncbi:TRAP transporter small permease subunit [Marinobacterium arenosum]|uniref:TRAP transporter small permease subunit n=1 Tax=Marinobacterium arenosum TaxID=2862496 RepID=UPI001C93A048|nr:TRAP transporter small permease [Marinobacterium arenosum]MBY4678784.1 TRAP transporter small permease [Marinobacterium arenosum]
MFENLAKLLDSLISRVNHVSRWIARLGGLILLGSVVMIIVEVAFRKLANQSIFPATEVSGYTMAIIASWSFAFAMLEKAHIRIDILYLKAGKLVRNLLDIIAICCLAGVCLYATHAVTNIAVDAYLSDARSNSPLMAPLWIPQFLWAVGFVWFSISITLLIIRSLLAFFSNDQKKVSSLIASPSVDDHINEITQD